MPETTGRGMAIEIVVCLAIVVVMPAAWLGVLDVVWNAGQAYHRVELNSTAVDSLASEAKDRRRQLDDADGRLKSLEHRVEGVEKRLDGLKTRVDAMSRKLDALIERSERP